MAWDAPLLICAEGLPAKATFRPPGGKSSVTTASESGTSISGQSPASTAATPPPTAGTLPVDGRVLLVIAALLWSSGGLFMKSAPMQAIPLEARGPLLACYRVLFAGLCVVPLVPWRSVRLRWELLATALAYTVMNALYVSAVTRTTAAAAIFLQYTSAGWSYLLGWLLLRERPGLGSLVAVAFAFGGIGVILASEWQGANWLGNLLAAGSGLAYAVVVIGMRTMRGEPSAWIVFCNNVTSGLLMLPWVLTFDVTLSGTQWGIIAGLGVLQMGIPYLLLGWGIRTMSAADATLITMLEAILNPIWVYLLIGERTPLATCVGGGLILVGLVLRYTLFRERPTW